MALRHRDTEKATDHYRKLREDGQLEDDHLAAAAIAVYGANGGDALDALLMVVGVLDPKELSAFLDATEEPWELIDDYQPGHEAGW